MKSILQNLLKPMTSISDAIEIRKTMVEFLNKWEKFSYSPFTGDYISCSSYLENFRNFQIAVDGPFRDYNGSLGRLRYVLREDVFNETTFLSSLKYSLNSNDLSWRMFFNIEKESFITTY